MKSAMGVLINRASSSQHHKMAEFKALNAERRQVESKINRFYEAIESGRLAATATLAKRQSMLEQERERLIRLMAMKENCVSQPIQNLT
tara:strand:+ start:92 stop:358 length:267 start_codon:yes stop_codon:yes gene_type:complete